jgi:hypothetical protein
MEKAKQDIRFMMNHIVVEADVITKWARLPSMRSGWHHFQDYDSSAVQATSSGK